MLIVAGDDHAHSGAQSQVFDNARRDLAKAFAPSAFRRRTWCSSRVDPDKDADATTTAHIANGLWDLSNRATGGCLIYFTSHGACDGGIVTGNVRLTPDSWSKIVDNACGKSPAVIVMSACFSGQFLPGSGKATIAWCSPRRGPTAPASAAAKAITYTFFDGCFLAAIPASSGFPERGRQDQGLRRPPGAGAGAVEIPSEPQARAASGKTARSAARLLKWRSTGRRQPYLTPMPQRRVRQHTGHHRFSHRHGADADTGIVAAFGDDLGVIAGHIDGLARRQNG